MTDTPPSRCRIYGISNCQTMKRAFAWLTAHGIAYDFVDYRRQPPTDEQLADWHRRVGWSALLNTRGTTWRRLDEDERVAVDQNKALRLMARQPTLIKRPLLETGDQLLLGFEPARYAEVFAVDPAAGC
ncbi:MAG: arsenate reductase [Candidatus Accumulibacter sp.]|nr:arsenate reductase [Accumulibacter sp.]